MNTKRTIAVFGIAALGLGISGCGTDDPQATGDSTLSIGVVGITSDASLAIADEQGYFEEAGISSVDTTTVSDPTAAIAAVQSGDIDIAYTPSIPYFNALSQGIDLTVVATAEGYPEGALDMDAAEIDDTGVYATADSSISSPADLENSAVAIPARNAQLEVTVSDAIQQDGGDPDTVDWMVLDFASALDALESGQIDAASVVSPFTQEADNAGHSTVSYPGVAFFEEGAIGLWVASPDQIEDNPQQYEAFQNAITQAHEYGNSNREDVLEYGSEITGIDTETLAEGPTTYWPIQATDATFNDLDRANEKMADLGYLTDKAPFEEEQIWEGQ